jgi:DEAD/DEAH box helicase domain-containing protein
LLCSTQPADKFEIPFAIYDGDTPSSSRPKIRQNAHLLISNPDMLHLGILPHHTSWSYFLQNLSFIVLDEAHIYRGVFGSHVANVIRRLKRIASYYGASPQFILTSATIANPIELAQKLTEEEIVLIDQDGSARGPRKFLIYNPPIIDEELGLRRSALQESVRLAEDLLTFDVQTIIFGRSRRSVELILTYLREHSSVLSQGSILNPQAKRSIENHIRGYRGGYLPSQRREVERGLRDGDIRTVIATNALELGIDIGGLGASLLVGYPGSIAATWQQSGRAGRGDETALSILVATSAPLDQFLASHPEYLFQRSPEHALINSNNLLILLEHIRCALFELPFNNSEGFGDLDAAQLREILGVLQEEGVLHTSKDKYFWMSDSYPAQAISLRSISTSPVNLQVWGDQGLVTIGQVDQASATWMVHPNAIYLHEGKQYLVEDLDFEANIAVLTPSNTDYYTVPRSKTAVQLIAIQNQLETKRITKAFGEIQITSQLTGFHKIRWYTHERLGTEELSMPPADLFTTGYWLSLSDRTVDNLRELGVWNSDPNNYGPNWNEQRDKARARDGYICRVCGVSEGEHAHHVHHITPFRTFSNYQEANRLENLTTLCPSCHRRVESAVRVRSGLAGLAYVFGQLAPFFVMCDSNDLGIHSDPKSPFTDGKPTIVIYDQAPDGLGFSQHLFEMHSELIKQSHNLVKSCPCSEGCPSCVGPGGESGQGSKKETLSILEILIQDK